MHALAPLLLVLLVTSGSHAADEAALQHPLGDARLELLGGAKRRLDFSGTWSGAAGASFDPTVVASTVRVAGGPSEGDTGVIGLVAARWHVARHGTVLRYRDRKGSAGGIRSITVRAGSRGGSVRIAGGPANWHYALERPPTTVHVTLTIGTARWCAEFGRPLMKSSRRRVRAESRTAPATCPCESTIGSTWEAIQTLVFDRHGCTQAVCHGSSPGQGDLDLRPAVAYRNLVDVPSTALPTQKRVAPGSQDTSLLWRKLAARTLGLSGVPGGGMPSGGESPLSTDELRAVESWIHNGAPERGVVPGTDALLASCLPPAVSPKIRPPDPPPTGEGVQFYGPPWDIPANSEGEVCYATYYDVSGRIPADQQFPCPASWGGPGRRCFYYHRNELTQDPNSHHAIVHIYKGAASVTDPGWGRFTCHGGANAGMPCDPTGIGVPAPAGADCGAGGGCAGSVVPTVACIGYGPPDLSAGFTLASVGGDNAPYIVISTQPFYSTTYASGVANVLPTSGILVWNSHAFNLTAQPTTNEQWLNVYLAGAGDRKYLLQAIFDADDIFVQDVPPFTQREYCRTHTFAQGTRVFALSSHTHKRGKLFRVWGPGIASECRSTAANPGACMPEPGAPVLTTTNYTDPAQVVFDPPLALDGGDASRRFKFCAVYDNGFTDPSTVKRRSTAPARANVCSLEETSCLAGPHQGAPCHGDDRLCDSTPRLHDGQCDACPLRGGVTTDDEMFILLGSSFCPEGTSCYLPLP